MSDTELTQLLERIKALEANREHQREFDMELRAALLSVVTVIERRWKIGKYKPVDKQIMVTKMVIGERVD